MMPFPPSSSVSSAAFLEFFVLFYGDENLPNEDVDFLKVLTQLDCSPLSQIQALKDFGNNLFRHHEFAEAGVCYDKACRLLSSSLKGRSVTDFNSFLSAAVSLCLNLAACANKLQASEVALTYCSMVLNFFPRNAKALFRKAAALKNLDRFSEACSILEEARSIEPHNKDILHELEAVQQSLIINRNGKRVVIEPLEDDEFRVGKQVVSSPQNQVAGMGERMAETVACAPSYSVSLAGCAPNSSPEVPMDTDSGSVSKGKLVASLFDPLTSSNTDDTMDLGCGSAYNGQMPLPCPQSSDDFVPPASPDTHMVSNCSTLPADTSVFEASQSSSPEPKSPHLRFSNKKRPHNVLHLSTQDYESLLHGKQLGYYHPRSMSFLRVQTLTSKTIQTGTPHEVHGTAEVPTPSPLPEKLFKSNVQHSENVELVEEEVTIGVDMMSDTDRVAHKEVVLHIAKKNRTSSNFTAVSKIYAAQYQFVAARRSRDIEHRGRLKKASSYRRRHVTHDRLRVKKRSLNSPDFSICLCRYTKAIVTVKRATRERPDLFLFNESTNPPYKKRRLDYFVSYSCNVSSFTWFYSSLQNSGSPGFVL